MTAVSRSDVEAAIQGYIDPYLEKDLLAAKAIKDIRIAGDRVEVDVQLGFPAGGYHDTLVADTATAHYRAGRGEHGADPGGYQNYSP